MYEKAVFVSYAWEGESGRTVDELERAFAEHGIRIVRDKKDLGYKGSIETFEQRIGQGQCIVLVISDKYLRSEHCMYELVEVDKNQGLRERVFPIVLSDAHIYKAKDRLTYINHWDKQIKQLNHAIKQVEVMTDLANILADLDKYARIRTNLAHLTDLLGDMNVLTPELHSASGFSTLISAVENAMIGKQTVSQLGKVKAQSDEISDKRSEQLRIFIGSPSDVDTERGFVYKVINDVEEILRIFKDHGLAVSIPPLHALEWEKALSDIGIPNNVILNRFPIEDSDIFIFILWKSFGTFPGTQGLDGIKYLSGTEDEFLKAFEQRKNSLNGRPLVMLCRKTDDFSLMGKSLEEITQYEKVARFFQECEPGGKHPTSIYDFKTSDFEVNLRRHLLDNVLRLYEEKQEEIIQEDQSVKNWLEHNNLLGNPFHFRFAEDEVDLTKYYIRFKNLQLNIDYLLKDKNSWLVFGREGSGKTALRKFLVDKCQNNPRVCSVEYFDEEKFTSALAKEQDPEKIALSIAIQICEIALENANVNLDFPKATDPSSAFLVLREKLKAQGIERMLIFIDPFREAVKNVAKVSSVLGRLANISIDGIGLRFFLPNNIYLTLSNKQHDYIGRCNPMEIKWEANELLDLVRYRLIYYSKDKRNANSSMGALGEPKGGMDRIDQAIVGLSENNPRAVIWLADQLISKHCQNQPIPLKIQRQTWDQVQEEWWGWGRNHVLGLSGQEDGFWQSGSDIFFKDKRLALSRHSKTLLGVLIEADGQICSKEKLIDGGWANESKDGITEAALREAMRRLKNELAERQAWLKTIHGQGYRLQNPDETEA